MAGKFLAYNGNVLDHIVGNRPGKSVVAGGDIENISLKQIIAAIQNSAEQIRMIQSQCSGVGTTLSPIGSSSGCILTPAQQTRINTYEKDIFQKIGEYLQFG